MGFNPKVKRELAKLTNSTADQLTEAEILTSPEMSSYLDGLSASMLGNYAKSGSVTVFSDKNDDTTAYTDGKKTVINAANDVIRFFETAQDRFICFMGIFFHEIAHRLFLDFNGERTAIKKIDEGKFYGEAPTIVTTNEETQLLQELEDAMSVPENGQIFTSIYHTIANIISDYHDEEAMMDKYENFTTAGILKARTSLQMTCESLEDMQNMVDAGQMPVLTLLYSMILQYSRFDQIFSMDDIAQKTDDCTQAFMRMVQHIDAAKTTDSTKEKFSEINNIVYIMWPFIQQELENQQNSDGSGDGQGNQSQSGSSSGGSGGSGGSGNQSGVQKVMDALQQAVENSGGGNNPQAPSGCASSQIAKNGKTNDEKSKQNPATAQAGQKDAQRDAAKAKSEQAMGDALRNVTAKVAAGNATAAMEQAQASGINVEIQTMDMSSTHRGIPVCVTRKLQSEACDKRAYKETMDKVGQYSKRLQKKMLEAMRDMRDGEVRKHRPFGRTLECNDAYRPDQCCFSSKKAPQDVPDMALAILVDHSGSMTGERIQSSMEAATLLFDFATGINIPVSVSGHRTYGHEVEYIVYSDFEQIGSDDKFRIASMNHAAGGCNRDGLAIEISAKRLAERPESLKLLIVVSDGQPNHDNYGGESAKKDIQQIVAKYRRKGVQTFAAAIGSDKDRIEEIYRDGFIDITDLATLPKVLVKLVSKKLAQQF